MGGRDGEEELAVLSTKHQSLKGRRRGEQREVSHSSEAVPALDRQAVGGCLSLKLQLFSSVTRCKLTFLGAEFPASREKEDIKVESPHLKEGPAISLWKKKNPLSFPLPDLTQRLLWDFIFLPKKNKNKKKQSSISTPAYVKEKF